LKEYREDLRSAYPTNSKLGDSRVRKSPKKKEDDPHNGYRGRVWKGPHIVPWTVVFLLKGADRGQMA